MSGLTITPLPLDGLCLVERRRHADERGEFARLWSADALSAHGFPFGPVQVNHSITRNRGTIRGLHYQVDRPQGKLVRAVRGSIWDVAVDIRPDSPAFGTWVACEISAENRRQLWVPAGLAHGFLVLSESAEVLYKTTDYYSPPGERCIVWNDPELAIEWPLTAEPVVSAKDQQGLSFAEAVPHVQA